MKPDEVTLPEEGSGKMFERELDEIYRGATEEESCTGESLDSDSQSESCKESESS